MEPRVQREEQVPSSLNRLARRRCTAIRIPVVRQGRQLVESTSGSVVSLGRGSDGDVERAILTDSSERSSCSIFGSVRSQRALPSVAARRTSAVGELYRVT